jgi:hypothetical protein
MLNKTQIRDIKTADQYLAMGNAGGAERTLAAAYRSAMRATQKAELLTAARERGIATDRALWCGAL